MSKFTKKLDRARQMFFSGGRNAGKKMKHDAAGNLDDDKSLTDANGFKLTPINAFKLTPVQQNAYTQLNQYLNQSAVGFPSSSILSNNSQLSNSYNSITGVNWISRNNYINSQQAAYQKRASYLFCNNPNCSLCGTGVTFPSSFIQTDPPIKLPRDPAYNNDFGWRCWSWCQLEKKLYSPIQNKLWPQAENHAHKWDESEVVRGKAGIHARFVPENWEGLECPDGFNSSLNSTVYSKAMKYDYLADLYGENWQHRIEITGIVERFGKYVEGTDGWRSEWAIIRKLYAPTNEIGLQLEQAFPEVEVIYASQQTDHPNPINFTDITKSDDYNFVVCSKCVGFGCTDCNGVGGTYQ